MRFSVNATPAELPIYFERFLNLIDSKKFRKRIRSIATWAKKPEGRIYIRQRLRLEWALVQTLGFIRKHGQYPWPPPTLDHLRLFSFASAVVSVHHRLDEKTKKLFSRELVKCLDQEDGFEPLAFEMRVAANFMARGCDVSFSDLEGKERFDFLVCKDDTIAEVECKYVSVDIGRKVPQKNFNRLAEYLRPIFDKFISRIDGGVLIHLELSGRLETTEGDFKDFKSAISKLLESDGDIVNSRFSLRKFKFAVSESPIVSGKRDKALEDEVRKYAEDVLAVNNASIMLRAELKTRA